MKRYYLELMSTEIFYMKYDNGRLTGLVISYAETAQKTEGHVQLWNIVSFVVITKQSQNLKLCFISHVQNSKNLSIIESRIIINIRVFY
jgi:hypothetical protein